MATKSLGRGTCNFVVNLLRGERTFLGQSAFERNQTMAERVRDLIQKGLESEDPLKAESFRTYRAMRKAANEAATAFNASIFHAAEVTRSHAKKAAKPAILLGLISAITVLSFSGVSDLRRPNRGRRTECCADLLTEEEEA